MAEFKKVTISIGDFALPVPRRGSIDALSGYGRTTQIGIEIHQQVQKRRARDFANYEAEVPIAFEVERGKFLFRIAGRIDGLFTGPKPRIEEIKSTFQIQALAKRMREGIYDHPYNLQLLTDGYFYFKQESVIPALEFHLVSTRNLDSENHSLNFNVAEYEEWMDRRLGELEEEALQAEKRAARRRKEGEGLAFPFDKPRSGQVE